MPYKYLLVVDLLIVINCITDWSIIHKKNDSYFFPIRLEMRRCDHFINEELKLKDVSWLVS